MLYCIKQGHFLYLLRFYVYILPEYMTKRVKSYTKEAICFIVKVLKYDWSLPN